MAEHKEHIVSPKIYIVVLTALLLGTGVTVWAAYIDLGRWNIVLALTIAVTKMTLVILFFMHVRWSSRLTWVVAGAGFFWLLLLFTVMGDYISQGWVGTYH